MATNMKLCMNCGIKEGFKRCVRCKLVFYCSKECQTEHWRAGHKTNCVDVNEQEKHLEEKTDDEIRSPESEMSPCLSCTRKEAKYHCGRCKERLYCSKKCQATHWKEHKIKCSEMRKNKVDTSAEKTLYELNNPNPASRLLTKGMEEVLEYMPSRFGTGVRLDIPNFHKEYHHVYPQEKEHICILEEAFNEQKLFGVQELFWDIVPWDMDMYIKRYGNYSAQLMNFLQSDPKPGDIFKSCPPKNYIKQRYQIFRNVPIKETSFEFGKTYVFIGYVDLLQIMIGKFTGNGDKLKYHGFDQSEICVARSLVIYEMMKMQASLDSILEVWFSTGWGKTTLKEFKAACHSVMKTIQETHVIELIQLWMTTELSLVEAKRNWIQANVEDDWFIPAGNLQYEKDRVEFCRYQLTGQLFGELQSQCHGNVTMFTRTALFKNYLLSAVHFFAAFSMSNSFKHAGSFLESVKRYYKSKLTSFIQLIAEGKVECSLNAMTVQLNNQTAVETIRSLQPHHIDWNNVADYMKKETFFTLAEACSNEETIHSMHFMNWSQIVYGTFILEYKNRSEVHAKQKKKLMELFRSCHDTNMMQFFRKDTYIVYPWNASTDMLALKYREKF